MNKEFEDGVEFENVSEKQEKERIALVEISPYQVKLSFAWYLQGAYEIFDEYKEDLLLHEDIERDGFIKPTQVAHCKETIRMYRKLCDALKITKSVAYATCDLRSAKNHYGFLDEMELSSGFKFKLLTEEDEIGAIHTGVVNSLDVSKGIILSVEQEQTRIIGYVRRVILGVQVIPFGYSTLCKLFMEGETDFSSQCKTIKEFFAKQIKDIDWLGDLELTDLQFVGMGDIFESIGKISRKGKKYSLDLAHNYRMNKNDFNNVYNAIVGLKLDKEARIKGVSQNSAGNIASGLSVVSALIDYFEIDEFSISTSGVDTGILFNHCVPVTNEKPLQDLLGYSLETNQKFYQEYQTNGAHIFELAMLLFKQLRVMHRLPRMYVKPLKIACYMYNAGSRLRFNPTKKDALSVILHSKLYGASHKDLVIAAFIASTQFSEEFSLSDWVKYKDIVDDEDLQAVKRLAILVRIATCFDIASQNNITDIVCDVLGDSVIMKTVTETDISFELKLANEAGNDFKKIFGKTLELL